MMKDRRGFTLIELLVASSMLAMLAAAGLAAFSAGTRSAAKARRYGAMITQGQAALRTMATDIRAAVAHGEIRVTALDAYYEGRDADTIDFIVARVKPVREELGVTGRYEVGYYIDNDIDTEAKGLIRREDETLDDDPLEGGTGSLVGPYVSELNLEFYDGLIWSSGWEYEPRFPRVICIQIVVEDEDEIEAPMLFSTTVPIMAR